ncbi:LuxR C-terminal-related transcriptional regulator [Roseateles sp. BYS87W]|uniref:LuxR C-terminal-related transcriptional regulator n=1 Tax=Pelomonas baiyunensis TaxID=3299026 RepID=A0ABW7H2N4_9BURK
MCFLLIDDHALLRDGLALMLAAANPGTPCVQAGSLGEGLDIARSRPDLRLVLLDLDLPDSHGPTGIPAVMDACPTARVVVLSAHEEPATVEACIEAGASGFVHKSAGFDELSAALALVTQGGIPLPQRLLQGSARPLDSALDALSARQHEVLQQLLRGASNKVIERELGLSASTVKTHLAEIYRRLGAANRTQAVVAAAALGLRITPGAAAP